MNRNDLYRSFNEVDDDILERSDISRCVKVKKKARIIPWRRNLAALIAAVLMAILSVGTALAVSPELRELVFRFFQIDQVESIPENNISSDLSVNDMFAEPSIRIGNVLQGSYVHTPVSALAQNGVFLICTDDIQTNQGSHYDAYFEKQGEFIKLEEQTFAQDYVLYDQTFHIQFHWAEYNGKVIITWIDEDAAFRIPNNADDPSALLLQLIFASTNEKNEYIESYYPVLLDLNTGQLTDVLAGTGADELEWIGNSAISEDFSKMLLCSIMQDGYTLHYVDLSSKQMYDLNELSGQKVDSCSLTENTLACWSLTDGYYKLWSIDLITLQKTELFDSVANAADTSHAGIVFLMGFDSWVHEGNLYTGSVFALETDEAQNVFVIDLATGQRTPIEGYIWKSDTQKIPSPDGRKLLLAECPDWQDYESVGVLDFENLTYTEFSRENRQNERLAYWFDEKTVVICGELTPESFCSDYYLYEIIPVKIL